MERRRIASPTKTWQEEIVPSHQTASKDCDHSGKLLNLIPSLFDAIRPNGPIRWASLDGARSNIELRSMPRALHRTTDHRSAGERPATMRTVIVESNVSLLRTGEDNAQITDV